MATVIFKFGTQNDYDRIKREGCLDSNALYFIEDTGRLYKGSVLMSEQVIFATDIPEFSNAKSNRIYVVTKDDEVSLYVKGATKMLPIEGGGSIKPGSITDLDIFNPDLLVDSKEELTDSDNQLPTAGAVKKAVDTLTEDLQKIKDALTWGSID